MLQEQNNHDWQLLEAMNYQQQQVNSQLWVFAVPMLLSLNQYYNNFLFIHPVLTWAIFTTKVYKLKKKKKAV